MDKAIVWVMAVFLLLGALDRVFGNRLKMGKRFEEGILSIGTLCLSMLGMMSLAPLLANFLRPVLVPVYGALGADPAMFAGSLLACDMGGASLAAQLAESTQTARFGGLIVGSMLGATLTFTLPVALGIVSEGDRPAFAKGILSGMLAIAPGAFLGGLTAGFSVSMLLQNLFPIVLFALLLALGLWRFEKAMTTGFLWFGRGVAALITLGLAAGAFTELTGVTLLPGAAPLHEGISTVAEIGFLLAGAFPLLYVLTALLQKPLGVLGKKLGINSTAAAGLPASLANAIAMLQTLKAMDERGKVVNVAFAVCAAFSLGDHLAFTAGFDTEMLLPVIVAKLSGGILAVCAALILTRGEKRALSS